MQKIIRGFAVPFKLIRNKIFFFIFLNGFLLAMLAYFYMEDNYESQIFKALAHQVRETSSNQSEETILLQSLQLTYNLEKYRVSVFGNKEINALKSNLIRPVTFDLMTGNGACGSYSFVLSRLLNELGIETRFAQMKVGDSFGGHILVEAKTSQGWVVLDASYNLHFRRKDGLLASFKDVQNDWAYFRGQVPDNYNMSYNYSDVQYTNWNKIPVLLPAVKGALNLTLGKERADTYSLRNLALQKYRLLFKISLVIYIITTLVFVKLYIRQSKEIEQFRLSLIFPKQKNKKLELSVSAA